MSLNFDEKKATQATAFFLSLHGGRMHYLKLIKLLYLADRAALLEWGIPITTDRYVSMEHGPVVSRIYNLIVDEVDKPIWAQFISAPSEYQVTLLQEAPTDSLSRAEERLIKQVYEKYGHVNRWDLVKYVHTLPEWQDPGTSSIPISIRAILEAGGESAEEIFATITELESIGAAQQTLRGHC